MNVGFSVNLSLNFFLSDKGLVIHNGRPKRNRKLTPTYVARPSKQGLGVEEGDTQAVLSHVDEIDEKGQKHYINGTKRKKRKGLTHSKTAKVSKQSQEVTKKELPAVHSLRDSCEDGNIISQADLDALHPGSRVIVYLDDKKCNTLYWNATVKQRKQVEQKWHFQIHFEGHKNKPIYYKWVDEDAIARIRIDDKKL